MLGRKEGVFNRECRTGSHLCRPNRHDVLCGDLFKVVDKPGCLLVVCKVLCSVTLKTLYLYTRESVVQSSGHSSHKMESSCPFHIYM